jgi:NTP pyrophosphatase (non-canonical NTP hydrolase)
MAEGEHITIASFQRLIRERYYETDSARGAPATFLWFMEEVGELATAIAEHTGGEPREAPDANLTEEFADVLAWLTTLANITGVDLSEALAKYTSDGGVEGVKS